MSYAGIQSTVNLCTMREADLTNQLTDIMTEITRACKDTSKLAEVASASREAVKGEYSPDSTEYEQAMDDIQEEYELNLAQISSWESELEAQKEEKETEIQATGAYKESFMSALKQNIQKDYKFGGNG